jgi:hypothetical protein
MTKKLWLIGPIHKLQRKLFSVCLIIGTNKLEFYIVPFVSMKKTKCCKYAPGVIFTTFHFL